jgi:hypothetical protein
MASEGSEAESSASRGQGGQVNNSVVPQQLFNETMSQAFAENLRRFVRFLPPEAALEVLAESRQCDGEYYPGKR